MKWMVVAFVAVITPSLLAQTATESASGDTLIRVRPDLLDSNGTTRVDTVTKYHPTKSAGLAMLLSALVPGAGQAYNESYWKVPIIVGLGVYFASQWLHNNRVYHGYRDQYLASVAALPPNGNGNLQALREFYRDQRDTFTWYFFILYFVNIADAYVDASLYDFNVSDNLSIRLMPESGTRLALRISF